MQGLKKLGLRTGGGGPVRRTAGRILLDGGMEGQEVEEGDWMGSMSTPHVRGLVAWPREQAAVGVRPQMQATGQGQGQLPLGHGRGSGRSQDPCQAAPWEHSGKKETQGELRRAGGVTGQSRVRGVVSSRVLPALVQSSEERPRHPRRGARAEVMHLGMRLSPAPGALAPHPGPRGRNDRNVPGMQVALCLADPPSACKAGIAPCNNGTTWARPGDRAKLTSMVELRFRTRSAWPRCPALPRSPKRKSTRHSLPPAVAL